MQDQRRATAGLEHQRHDLQLPPVDQLRIEDDDDQARRHPLHRYTARRDLWEAEGSTGVAQAWGPRGMQRREARGVGVQSDLTGRVIAFCGLRAGREQAAVEERRRSGILRPCALLQSARVTWD